MKRLAFVLLLLFVGSASNGFHQDCRGLRGVEENQPDDSDPPIDDTSSEVVELVPDELLDPVFDRFVDLNVIRKALRAEDSAALTDCVLLLQEGEKVLQRPHQAVRSESIFKVAVGLAARNADRPSLERLGKAALTSGQKELAEIAGGAKVLIGKSRSSGPGLFIDADKLSADDFAILKAILKELESVQVLGDAARLDELEKLVQRWNVDAKIKTDVTARIQRTRKEMPATPAAEADVLLKLSGASRGGSPDYWEVQYRSKGAAKWKLDSSWNVFMDDVTTDVFRKGRTLARNRESQLKGCGYDTRIITAEMYPHSSRIEKAPCPVKPPSSTPSAPKAIKVTIQNRASNSVSFWLYGPDAASSAKKLNMNEVKTFEVPRPKGNQNRPWLAMHWTTTPNMGISEDGDIVMNLADGARYEITGSKTKGYNIKSR